MRQAEASGWIVRNPSRTMMRALRLAAIVLGIGLVMSANAARAEDDERMIPPSRKKSSSRS